MMATVYPNISDFRYRFFLSFGKIEYKKSTQYMISSVGEVNLINDCVSPIVGWGNRASKGGETPPLHISMYNHVKILRLSMKIYFSGLPRFSSPRLGSPELVSSECLLSMTVIRRENPATLAMKINTP
ncbi:hypothetical protein NIES2100_02960 [Calothrix sp. NIES-2100]|nr:hypothetical protein NIES2100_02960 [Calothrix sp. NIES-2100]